MLANTRVYGVPEIPTTSLSDELVIKPMNDVIEWKKEGLRWMMDYEIYKAVDMKCKQKWMWRINIRLIYEQMGTAPLLNKWNLNWDMIRLKKEATWILEFFARTGGPTLAARIKSWACCISANSRYVQICTCHMHYNQHFYNTNSTYQYMSGQSSCEVKGMVMPLQLAGRMPSQRLVFETAFQHL